MHGNHARLPSRRWKGMVGIHKQRGNIAPLMVLAMGGVLLATAYVIDTSRMTNSAAQVKRATDAAAIAVGHKRLVSGEKADDELEALAYGYVSKNLGMDVTLAERINQGSVELSSQMYEGGRTRYKVEVTFLAEAELLGAETKYIRVHSVVEVQPSALEVVLTLPNTLAENERNMLVLRRQGKRFAERLLEDREDAWLALVPFSQVVNVSPGYTNPASGRPAGPSADHMQRLINWAAPEALRPIELTSLFRSGYSGLHDRRIPDRRANLLCMYRGLSRGKNYSWDESPSNKFLIYYRHDLPENGSPGATPISWTGPNPDFGQAGGVNDTRWMVADRGCPSAPLLPLTNDISQIEERLDQMAPRANVNYAIAMGWSAMALAPAFRGNAGWGLPDDLPKDFKDEGGDSYKAIVMLVNTTGVRWFDSDAYNAYISKGIDGQSQTGGENVSLRTQRFASLCESFRERKLRFFLIAIGVDEIENNDPGADGSTIDGASDFRRIAGPGLARCAEKGSDITYITGLDFASAEGRVQARLDDILEDIRQKGSYIRLVE